MPSLQASAKSAALENYLINSSIFNTFYKKVPTFCQAIEKAGFIGGEPPPQSVSLHAGGGPLGTSGQRERRDRSGALHKQKPPAVSCRGS
jgi:hypothetical protein